MLEETKFQIRSVLISSPRALGLNEFQRDYEVSYQNIEFFIRIM